MASQYRLVTRSDFDGIACAVLLRELDLVDEIAFVHPKDMQDGKIPVSDRDITANLPYVEGVHLAFDHHLSETLRLSEIRENHIIEAEAPSAARVIYDYYGGALRFPKVAPDLMTAVDKSDAAQFTREEVLNPQDWVLLSFLMDARTGLGRFREFRISNYDLMMKLVDMCRDRPIADILADPDVQERVELYQEQALPFRDQLLRCTEDRGNFILIDLRAEDPIYAGNRFLPYALFPNCRVSVHILRGKEGQNTVFALGKSIFDRTSNLDIGALCLRYGGGGHANAGTCQIPLATTAAVRQELVDVLQREA
ncbi:MAG: exopolyphosphatase [Oscillatoriales cyanobacterium SM2_1_8]|nr:exopolyphosphatase [Oscillatoriales cyanobacterium SM2_1_8]